MNPQPKQTTPRNAKYLKWIATLPCHVCNRPAPSHAHHTETGGIGIKGSDYSAIPLCADHHREVHDNYGKKCGWTVEALNRITARYNALYSRRPM